MEETDVIFPNKCGFCEFYDGIQMHHPFTENAPVKCSRGINKRLKQDCDAYSPAYGRRCGQCFYASKSDFGLPRCQFGHQVAPLNTSPCYDEAQQDYWVNNQKSSVKKGCFLSTVACVHQGLPDDCLELTTLRHFRDTQLLTDKNTAKLVAQYYQESPKLAEALYQNKELSHFIFQFYITDIVSMIRNHKDKFEIIEKYQAMFDYVQLQIGKN